MISQNKIKFIIWYNILFQCSLELDDILDIVWLNSLLEDKFIFPYLFNYSFGILFKSVQSKTCILTLWNTIFEKKIKL